MKKLLTFVFISCFFILGSCDDETQPIDDDVIDENPIEENNNITIDETKSFIHPGLLHSKADFNRMKNKVDANVVPWIDGWNVLIANSHASINYNPAPVEKLIRGGSSAEEPDPDNYSRAMNDVAAAYQLAIRWQITGQIIYAEKSIQILNAWASTCKSISGNSNTALAAGIYGYQFANAAEIMRNYEGWSSSDFETFKQWQLNVFYKLSMAFLETHWGTCKSHYWANWDLCNLANVMATGVLCDSMPIYKYAIEYLMDGDGNGNLTNCINYIHPKSTNDDIDLGQLQESGRDQGHSLFCIGLLGNICQMAYNQGDDLFAYDDNRILKAAEYTAKYNFANLSVPFHEYTRNFKDAWSACGGVETHIQISDIGKSGKRPIWELLYNHYVVKKGITARYVTMAAKAHRIEGGGGDYGPNSGGFDNLGFGTLLFSLDDGMN